MALRLRILTGVVFLLLSICAFAQSDSNPQPVEAAELPAESADINEFDDEYFLEEVIVTGTRIARRDFNTPSPLTTIDSDVIAFAVQPTLEDTLNQMPQVFPSFGRASNNPGGGVATVDLRGFGTGRSLVLLNSRRVAPSDTGNEVDLNNIPRLLIQRVEIITGGTSTVYGSDAIAGVVNFITKSDYTGFGVEAGFSITEEGDGKTYDLSLAYGHDFSNGHGNITFYANWLERKPLFAGARESTRVAYFDDWEGNLVEGGSSRTPAGRVNSPSADLGDGPVQVTFNPDGTPREFISPDDLYNYQPVNYLQIPLTRYAVGAMGHYDLSPDFEGYFEASFIRNESSNNLAAVPAQLFLEINLDNPVLVPEAQQLFTDYYSCAPNLACISFSRRLLEVGPRIVDFERDYSRVLAGFRGELGKGWDIDAWITYTDFSAVYYLRNDVSRSRFLQGMVVDSLTNECYDPSGGCVPLNVFGEGNLSAEGADFIRFTAFENVTERTNKLASVFVTGSPFEIWAGPLDIALGMEWRSDDTHFESDDALFTGDALGYGGFAPVDGVDKVFEIYGEALVPLLSGKAWVQNLDLEIGGRYSNYKLAGSVWTYKAGISWQVFDGLNLRAMHQRSVRAPNSAELFEEQGKGEWVFVGNNSLDPCSASSDPVGNGNVEKCIIQGLAEDQIGIFEAIPFYPVDFFWGGNPDLVPEVGKTWTVGSVITPTSLPNWQFTVDYFYLEVTDTIGEIESDLICFDPLNTGNVFCENLKRDASGNVFEISDLTSNRGLLETSGIDTQVQYQTDLPGWTAFQDYSASLMVNVYWTHVFSFKNQENPATEILECAGYFGWPCQYRSYPANRVTTNFTYTSGPLELYLSWRWIDGMKNAAPKRSAIFGVPDPDLAVPVVKEKHYLDVGSAYTFRDRYQLRFIVSNLLGTKPPQMADQSWSNNTDEGLYDVFGRSYRVTLSAQF
jgi:iron complex outermembrane receptor protein